MAKTELNIWQKKMLIVDAMGGGLEKKGKGRGFAYHQIDDVHEALRPLLIRFGVSFEYSVIESKQITVTNRKAETLNINEKILEMRLVNIDKPEEVISGRETGYGIDFLSGDKGPGIASAYAVKTWLVNVFHLKGQVDLDGNHDGHDDEIAEYITPNQVKAIANMVELSESDLPKFLKWIGAASIATITASDYDKAEKMLQLKLEKVASK